MKKSESRDSSLNLSATALETKERAGRNELYKASLIKMAESNTNSKGDLGGSDIDAISLAAKNFTSRFKL